MSKAVLISIRPEWCEKIANGEKTIEVRKTRPKLEPPFKCYIYCTNTRPFLVWGDVFRGNWETEFTHLSGYSRKEAEKIWDVFNGHVIGEFVCDEILDTRDVPIKLTCLTTEEWLKYSAGKSAMYGWQISNLVIYDEPKELSKFTKPCVYGEESDVSCFLCDKSGYTPDMHIDCFNTVTRPPQSWCYVEEVDNG